MNELGYVKKFRHCKKKNRLKLPKNVSTIFNWEDASCQVQFHGCFKQKSLHVFTKVFFFYSSSRCQSISKTSTVVAQYARLFQFCNPRSFPLFQRVSILFAQSRRTLFFHQTFPDENRRLKSSSSLSCKVNKLCIVLRIRLQD